MTPRPARDARPVVATAIKAAKRAGFQVRIEIDPTGKTSIAMFERGEPAADDEDLLADLRRKNGTS